MDNLTINTLRFLAAEAIQKAKSGHPGLPLGAAPAAYTLWAKELKANPANPNWDDRDRFILSAGHGSALLYSLLLSLIHIFVPHPEGKPRSLAQDWAERDFWLRMTSVQAGRKRF